MYIAKAYVSIPDSKTRNEVIEKLNELGYHYDTPPNDIDYIAEIIHIRDGDLFAERIKYFSLTEAIKEAIDCNAYTPNGTEEEAVKLFLELAQMKGDSKYVGQWRKKGKVIFKLAKESIDSYWCINSEVVSPIRLAIAFRDGEVNL